MSFGVQNLRNFVNVQVRGVLHLILLPQRFDVAFSVRQHAFGFVFAVAVVGNLRLAVLMIVTLGGRSPQVVELLLNFVVAEHSVSVAVPAAFYGAGVGDRVNRIDVRRHDETERRVDEEGEERRGGQHQDGQEQSEVFVGEFGDAEVVLVDIQRNESPENVEDEECREEQENDEAVNASRWSWSWIELVAHGLVMIVILRHRRAELVLGFTTQN